MGTNQNTVLTVNAANVAMPRKSPNVFLINSPVLIRVIGTF